MVAKTQTVMAGCLAVVGLDVVTVLVAIHALQSQRLLYAVVAAGVDKTSA